MNKRIDAKARAVVFFATLGIGACGSGKPGELGDGILLHGAQQVTFQSDGGGFHGVPPTGAACDPAKWTYVINLVTHDVTWTGCNVNGSWDDPASFVPATADHRLDGSTWPAVQNAVQGVYVSSSCGGCGADKDSWSLTVQRADGEVTYGDDFYCCQHQSENYVNDESLTALYATLSNLP